MNLLLLLHRCEAPSESSATQTYGQGPAGTLTIGFEEQVKVWLARHGSRCNSSTTCESSKGPIGQRNGLMLMLHQLLHMCKISKKSLWIIFFFLFPIFSDPSLELGYFRKIPSILFKFTFVTVNYGYKQIFS